MIELVIRFNPETKHVEIHGPLGDRMLCYGLLGMAREIVAKSGQQPAGNGPGKIVVPQVQVRGPLKLE